MLVWIIYEHAQTQKVIQEKVPRCVQSSPNFGWSRGIPILMVHPATTKDYFHLRAPVLTFQQHKAGPMLWNHRSWSIPCNQNVALQCWLAKWMGLTQNSKQAKICHAKTEWFLIGLRLVSQKYNGSLPIRHVPCLCAILTEFLLGNV